jgi:signal transduction histidine kinase
VSLDVPPDLAAVADRLRARPRRLQSAEQCDRYGEPPFRVSAEQRDRHLRITVSDEGAGVPEELRSRLFERFARGAETAAAASASRFARSYARAHGGDIVY